MQDEIRGTDVRKTGRDDGRDERGVSMVFVAVALTALLGASALAIDVGAVWVARTQLQNGADAAALGAASNMIDMTVPAAPVVTLGAAEGVAQEVGSDNGAISALSLDVLTSDIAFGRWDLDTRTFDTGVDLSDPEQVTAVQVMTRLDDNANGPLPAFMSKVLGRQDFDVQADAIAYLGWAGKVPEKTLVLPIMIDCCKLAGSDCKQDYCATVANPPNACDLEVNPQDHDAPGSVSCLEFHSTPEQNACWTQFEHTPSINTSEMTDIIESGVEFEVAAGESYYSDNGTKTPVVEDIHDRFMGEGSWSGGNGDGVDRYAPFDGNADSWVVTLPVVECQTGIHCSGGDETMIVGFVCFEIREVEVTPDKEIRGRFLCPTDPLFEEECDITTGSGGDDFGIRADIPVLVQ
jgi:hypothetical protein